MATPWRHKAASSVTWRAGNAPCPDQGDGMGHKRWQAAAAGLLLLCGGCLSGPLLDNPVRVQPVVEGDACTPVYIPLGPSAYGLVFEHVLDVVDDYFEISEASRYTGRIETFPSIAPGLEQPWKRGSPDFEQRLLATFQTIRHRAVVNIRPAEDGFFVEVVVLKELEDLERPAHAQAGAATFRTDNSLERQFEVIELYGGSAGWIPIGRDHKLEQVILGRLQRYDPKSAGHPHRD